MIFQHSESEFEDMARRNGLFLRSGGTSSDGYTFEDYRHIPPASDEFERILPVALRQDIALAFDDNAFKKWRDRFYRAVPKKKHSTSSDNRDLFARLLSSIKSLATTIKQTADEERHRVKGGPGSGHHGHGGRPGQRGGSSPGGGNIASLRGQIPSSDSDDGQKKILAMIGTDWQSASRDKREDVKDQVVSTLTNRMIGRPEDVPVSDDPSIESPWNEAYDNVNDFVGQWSRSSNDEDMRSLAMQRDAAAEFDLPLSEFTRDRIENMQQRAEAERRMLGARAKLSETLMPLLPAEQQRAILREMYNETQEGLRAEGLKTGSYVTLYRGIQLPIDQASGWRIGDSLSIEGNAIESWSLDSRVADQFAARAGSGLQGITFKMAVPVEMILSTCITGFGCLTEAEVTILGSDGEAQIEWMSMVEGD